MKTAFAVLCLVLSAFGAVTKITMPTDFSSVASGTRANLKANFDETQTRFNSAADSIDEVRGRISGYTGELTFSSLDNLRFRLDTDGSSVARFYVANGYAGDSLFRVAEDSTWKFWGAGIATKLTLSDSILAATARISGNGYFGGTLTAAGATSLAGLTATTGAFSSNVTVGGTFGVTGASTLAALSATTGAFSSNATVGGTFAVSGQSTMAGLEISGGSSGAGRMYSSSSLGFNIQARTGSSYDFSITQPGGAPSYLLRVPTGTATIEIPGAATVGTTFGVTGAVTASSTGAWTGKLGTADSLYAEDGLRVGATGASNVNWNRSGADMWNTPDSVTVGGKIIGSDTVVATRGVRTGGGEAFTYGDTSFTLTVTSGMTTTPSGTAYATRIGRTVVLHIPYLDGVSNATGFYITGIPSGWRPARGANVGLCPCFDNSANDSRYGCHLSLDTSGGITLLFSGVNTGNFTTSGNKGLGSVATSSGVTVTYQLQ